MEAGGHLRTARCEQRWSKGQNSTHQGQLCSSTLSSHLHQDVFLGFSHPLSNPQSSPHYTDPCLSPTLQTTLSPSSLQSLAGCLARKEFSRNTWNSIYSNILPSPDWYLPCHLLLQERDWGAGLGKGVQSSRWQSTRKGTGEAEPLLCARRVIPPEVIPHLGQAQADQAHFLDGL